MLGRLALSMRAWLVAQKNTRELSRLDCRCLEDIGLVPKDVTSCLRRPSHRIKHHPSWDGEERHSMHP